MGEHPDMFVLLTTDYTAEFAKHSIKICKASVDEWRGNLRALRELAVLTEVGQPSKEHVKGVRHSNDRAVAH